jgi:homoserine acetyltransferase
MHAVSEIAHAQNGTLLVAQITYREKEHYAPMNDNLKSQIKFSVMREKQKAMMQKVATEFMSKYQPAQYLAMAKAAGYDVIDASGVKKYVGFPQVGLQPELTEAILKANANQFTTLVSSKDGYFLAYVTRRVTPDMKNFEAKKKELAEATRNREEEAYLTKWYTDLRDKAKVIDNRADFNF